MTTGPSTQPTTVPPRFTAHGTAPTGDTTCKTCQAPYHEHTGATCAICRAPIEHHGPGIGERISFDDCITGRARMADARRHSGVDLDSTDITALEAAGEQQ